MVHLTRTATNADAEKDFTEIRQTLFSSETTGMYYRKYCLLLFMLRGWNGGGGVVMVTMHSKQHQKSYAKLNTQRFVLGCNNYFICLLLLKRTILLSVSPGMLWEVDVQTSQAPKQCVAVRTQEHWLIWLDLCEDTGSLIDQVALPYVRTQEHWLTDLACLM